MPGRRDCANAIRALSIDAIEAAQSGHPGAPLGMADMGEALWGHYLKHNPADPLWPDRDRFILSNGHASAFLYSLLHLTGYNLPLAELEAFRKFGSRTPGHPERGMTPGVEMTTGPLGQGFASAVGFALAEALLASEFNRPGFPLVDHHTYAFCGDGCLMEGVTHEAAALAAIWKLGKLIVFYDDNSITIDGKTEGWFNEDVGARYKAYGWRVIGPVDGHNFKELDEAIEKARVSDGRPVLIICKTHIGRYSPKADTSASHSSPLGPDGIKATKEAMAWPYDPFEIPNDIRKAWDAREKGAAVQEKWQKMFAAYGEKYPDLAREFSLRIDGKFPSSWNEFKKTFLESAIGNKKPMATRVASRECLELLVPELPALIGGSADLSSSVGVMTSSSKPLDYTTYVGNYIHYGVREFGMGAIMNGLAMHGGFIPFAGTFLAFLDQAKNAVRLSALMGLRVIWILTHDSIGVGEDGPTHQPVEQLAGARALPNCYVWHPCDNVETAQSWIAALECPLAPSLLVFSRQAVNQVGRTPEQVADIQKGGYILRDCPDPELILIASGSEVGLALKAREVLDARKIRARVVSMPCCEVFDKQPEAWREKVLPRSIRKRIAIEASSAQWWERYAGLDGKVIGMRSFGASAPYSELFDRFGFTVENVVQIAENLLRNN